jgi:hypothetical protein
MSAMTQIAGWTAIVGAISGPGYFLYCNFYSGSQVGKYEMSKPVRSWSPPGGETITFDDGAYAPFSVMLDPQMNPVAFIWNGDVSSGRNVRLPYRARLFLRDRLVMDKSISVSADRDETSIGELIGVVRIQSAGQHHFVLERRSPRIGNRVSSLTIEIRRNVVILRRPIASAGFALLIFFGLLYFWLKNRERKAIYEIPQVSAPRGKVQLPEGAEGLPPGTCPFCGKALKTPRAKQCLLCGADWHTRDGP